MYAPDAVVHHAVHARGALGALKDARNAAGRVKAFADHPGLRSTLDKGIFLDPSHALLAQAVLGVWLSRRKRATLLFTLPYAIHVARRASTAGAPPATAAALAARDLIEVAATLYGAVRYRAPVL